MKHIWRSLVNKSKNWSYGQTPLVLVKTYANQIKSFLWTSKMDLIPHQVSQDSLSWSVWYQSDFKWNHSLSSLSPKRSLHWPWRNLPCPLIGKLYVIAISNQCTFKLVTNDYRWVIYRQAVVEREKHGDQSAFNLTSLSSRNSTLTEQVFNQAVDKCPKVQSVSITSPGISDTQLYR